VFESGDTLVGEWRGGLLLRFPQESAERRRKKKELRRLRGLASPPRPPSTDAPADAPADDESV
jgi:hypothetical protein